MKKEIVIKHLGLVLLLNAIFIFIAFIISYAHNESAQIPLLFSALVCFILGIFPLIFVEKTKSITFI